MSSILKGWCVYEARLRKEVGVGRRREECSSGGEKQRQLARIRQAHSATEQSLGCHSSPEGFVSVLEEVKRNWRIGQHAKLHSERIILQALNYKRG